MLETIIKHGLSIRQIPEQVTHTYTYNDRDIKEGAEIIESVIVHDITFEQYSRRKEKGAYSSDHFRWEDGKVYRKFCRTTSTPAHAGYWMCKEVKNTSSAVTWILKNDNLAPTLEESIQLFLTKKENAN